MGIGALQSNLYRITGLILGNLSRRIRYGNPELNSKLCLLKCEETIYPASLWDGEIVQAFWKHWEFLSAHNAGGCGSHHNHQGELRQGCRIGIVGSGC